MKYRNPIPPAKEIQKLFVYRDGWLYWRENTKYGGVCAGDKAGHVSKDGYVRVGIYGVSYMAHRLIWRLHHPKGLMPFILDHIDGDKTNNKMSNLRKVSHGENMRNQHKKARKTTGTGKLAILLNT